MLVSGAAVSAALWRFLMLEPGPPGSIHVSVPEHLSSADRHALEHLFDTGTAR